MAKGRPTKCTPAITDEICRRISEGVTLAEICRDEHMPDRSTVYDWINADEQLSQRFARAREIGFDAIADECLTIADNTSSDTIKTERGGIPDTEWIQRSKLRVETRLKLLAKWSPKRYGDSLDLTSGGEKLAAATTTVVVRPPLEDE